ncbi:hypothetical protein ILUMI_23937 [Ignelater luminosus]|uniref:Uncharacterized protein n=1 Tax=Ignelater luminosus TaxID=2038154 RepID=A0A8K0CBH6_IGNLU|nr:hypothetical protein ILUMI_23937 [Ignelater luminosus]
MGFKQIILFAAIMVAVIMAMPQSTSREAISEDAIDKALSDRRYLTRQLKCALGEVPCDSVGRRLKSLAPLVLRGSCPQCSPQEMRQVQKVLAYVQKNFPKEWNKMLQLYSSG